MVSLAAFMHQGTYWRSKGALKFGAGRDLLQFGLFGTNAADGIDLNPSGFNPGGYNPSGFNPGGLNYGNAPGQGDSGRTGWVPGQPNQWSSFNLYGQQSNYRTYGQPSYSQSMSVEVTQQQSPEQRSYRWTPYASASDTRLQWSAIGSQRSSPLPTSSNRPFQSRSFYQWSSRSADNIFSSVHNSINSRESAFQVSLSSKRGGQTKLP